MHSVERVSQIPSKWVLFSGFPNRFFRLAEGFIPCSNVQLTSTFILEMKSRYQWGLINSVFIRNLQEGTAAAVCGMEQIIALSGLTKVLRVAAVGSCPATWWLRDDCTWISKLARDTVVYIVLSSECNELQSSCTYVYWRHVTPCGKRNSFADRSHS